MKLEIDLPIPKDIESRKEYQKKAIKYLLQKKKYSDAMSKEEFSVIIILLESLDSSFYRTHH